MSHQPVVGYCSDLTSGETLYAKDVVWSGNGKYRLVMQGDGNLVEYQGSKALWATGTNGDKGALADMQSDGNLVIYLKGVAKWSSKTNGFSGASLVVQNDANLVIYAGGIALWDRRNGLIGPCSSSGYTCTPGYTGSNASSTSWPWEHYGGSQAQTTTGIHNCTLYAAWRLYKAGMTKDPGNWGNAGQWANSIGHGNHTPTVGSVAWYGDKDVRPLGHVAYVEAVSGGNVFLRADKWSSSAGSTTAGWVAASSVPLFLHPHG